MRGPARRALDLLLLAGLLTGRPAAAAAQADTISPRPLFTAADALLAGGIVFGARLIHPLDAHYMRRLQDSSTQANRKLQVLATIVRTTAAPGSWIIGGSMYAVGRLSGNTKLADLGLHGTEALIVGEITATVMKVTIGRARPYVNGNPNDYQFGRGFTSGDYKSFPSGHSVAAFAAAAAVSSETSRWAPGTRWIIGPVMYGGAALVGTSRMYNNQHWASDVIVGAGIGTLAGLKVVRYHHSHPGNRLDRWLLAGSLVPDGDGGRSLRWSLVPGGLSGNSPPPGMP
jgi:membrane-associated phospholipid phosphatase